MKYQESTKGRSMHRRSLTPLTSILAFAGLLAVVALMNVLPTGANMATATETTEAGVLTEVEAQGRARLLHEAFHATLQFVHHEYYRLNQKLTLPAATLERVFEEMESNQNVKLRWLAVNAQAMNVDHAPQDEFEKQAVTALSAGQNEFSRLEKDVYRHAGAITLTSECLKCHAPTRTNNKDRAAALVITIPLRTKSKTSEKTP